MTAAATNAGIAATHTEFKKSASKVAQSTMKILKPVRAAGQSTPRARRPNGREKFIERGKVGRIGTNVGHRFDQSSACKYGRDHVGGRYGKRDNPPAILFKDLRCRAGLSVRSFDATRVAADAPCQLNERLIAVIDVKYIAVFGDFEARRAHRRTRRPRLLAPTAVVSAVAPRRRVTGDVRGGSSSNESRIVGQKANR
jgi:hypothetical protein